MPPPTGQEVLQILNGPWVTSHTGLLQMTREVQDLYAPPQTAGYNVTYKPDGTPLHFKQREGFFHTAAVHFYDFDGNGNLTGYMEHARGGYEQPRQIDIQGTYEAWKSVLGSGNAVYWGRIYPQLSVNGPNYFFVMKSRDELEWVWVPPKLDPAPPPPGLNQPRPLIARGTMSRIGRI